MAFIAYALFGTALGASASTMSFMWATLYGHQHIGEIKGSIAIIRNGATAIAPIGFSLVIDQWNIPFETVFWNSGLIIMSASLIALFIHHWDQRLTHYQTAIE